jgi:hypothetical protein
LAGITNLSGYFTNAAIPKQTIRNKKAAEIPQLTNHPGGLPKIFWMAYGFALEKLI